MTKYLGHHLVTSIFFPYKLNIYLFSFFLFYSTNIYSQNLSAEKIYKKLSDAVVVINCYNDKDKLIKQGSGVIIKDKEYVITNYHVIAGCERFEISHDKNIIPYNDIIGIDVNKDIFIIKIGNVKSPKLKICNSNSLVIGQRVYTIGSPLGFENTISEGIISGLRNYDEMGKNLIQITASISPGSSGGAVVNDKGELIGISTLSAKDGQNLNFAIPINEVLSIELRSYSENKAYKDYDLFYKGNEALESSDYTNAIKYFKSFIEKYSSAEVYNNLAIAQSRIGDSNAAMENYNKAIEINPTYADAYYNRGTEKSETKNYEAAIQDFNRAIDINPNYTNAYNNRGITKSYLKEYIDAIQDFNKAIEIDPNHEKAYFSRGLAKYNLKDFRGAIQDLNKTIEINPFSTTNYTARGLIKFEFKDISGACLDFSKAGELGDVEAYHLIEQLCN